MNPFVCFSFVCLFVCLFSFPTNKEGRKQTNEHKIARPALGSAAQRGIKIVSSASQSQWQTRFCLFVFQTNSGFAHACDPAAWQHKSIVTNWRQRRRTVRCWSLFVCLLRQSNKWRNCLVLFSELHKEGPVLEAALLQLFVVTSTERGMDSLVTQWKVDIRPDTPIINMDKSRGTVVNMCWRWKSWQVVIVINNRIKILSKLASGHGDDGGTRAANLKVTVPIGHTMY